MSAPTVTFDGATLRRTDTGEEIVLPSPVSDQPDAAKGLLSGDPGTLAWMWVAIKLRTDRRFDDAERGWMLAMWQAARSTSQGA